MEVERLQREYPVNVRWAPYLLNPSIPPEGAPRKRQTKSDTPRSQLELMAEARGITMRRGRTFTPNSHLALEAVEFAYDHGQHSDGFHRALFKANFEDFENIGNIDVIARVAGDLGIDADALRRSLIEGEYRERVDDQIEWARGAGVTGIPTFIFDYKYSMSGAQEYDVFQSVVERLGYTPLDGVPRTSNGAAESGEAAGHVDAPEKDPDWAI